MPHQTDQSNMTIMSSYREICPVCPHTEIYEYFRTFKFCVVLVLGMRTVLGRLQSKTVLKSPGFNHSIETNVHLLRS